MVFAEQLYSKYQEEMKHHRHALPMDKAAFSDWAGKALEKGRFIRQGDDGILFYSTRKTADEVHCTIPVYGYFADGEKTLSLLFQRLAGQLVCGKTAVFSVELYGHDAGSIRLFSMLQFGIMAEKGICKAEREPFEGEGIRALSKAEIGSRWAEVWGMTRSIVEHLRQSPVFYPGTEFTEALYREFYLRDDTTVFAAFAEDGTMTGMIETNGEQNAPAFGNAKSVNIGEIYVLPAYRGSGLAQNLLLFAQTHSGTEYSWLEHGTANPNARGFWGKYYSTYTYTMTREIRSIRRP